MCRLMLGLVAALTFAIVAAPPKATAAERTPEQTAGQYESTPHLVVNRMLDLAQVGPHDLVVDLGSGDGRLVIAAATQRGATGFGVDIDAGLVKLANDNARREGVADRVSFRREDLFSTDVSTASVVTLYLLPDTVPKLVPKLLRELKPGARVVSHDYPLVPWRPAAVARLEVPEKIAINGASDTVLYLYVVPALVEGTWEGDFPATISKKPVRLTFRQQPRGARGASTINGRTTALTDFRLEGTDISFSMLVGPAQTARVKGVVDEQEMRGTVETTDGVQPWMAAFRP